MSKTILYIVIGVVLIGIIALFIFGKNVEFGSIIAAVATGFAVFKTKLFGSSSANVSEQIASVENDDILKRNEWKRIKDEYDSQFNAIKARMDYLDYKSARIALEINNLDAVEKKALEKNRNITDDEILEFLRK